MEFLWDYLIKLSASLTLVYLFYQLILRRLTFYEQHRWYFLGYTLLAFFIPLVDISTSIANRPWAGNPVLNWVPVIHTMGGKAVNATTHPGIDGRLVILWVLIAGVAFMFFRIGLQLLSFTKLRKKATKIVHDDISICQVDDNIIPFSFGNKVYLNRHLHTDTELQKIIRHEFVHVKQKHSIDIIWAELLCALNWYNPFAWLLKSSIRQNLEFIADDQVLQSGIDKKEYQYLLLKVVGNNQYSIASQFNFSSLKKRIAMMNKTRTAKAQLLRLLILLPVTALLLLAFRSKRDEQPTAPVMEKKVALAGLVVDSRTLEPLAGVSIYCKEKNITVRTDERGYYLLQLPIENKELIFTMQLSKAGYQPFLQSEHWGNFYEATTYERYSKSVEYFGLSSNAEEGFSSLHPLRNGEGLDYQQVSAKLKNIFNQNSKDFDGTISRDTFPKKLKSSVEASATSSTAAGNSYSTGNAQGTGNAIGGNQSNAVSVGDEPSGSIKATSVTALTNENGYQLEKADIEFNESKRLVILDGKELPKGPHSLKGTFKLLTLSAEEGQKKYGEKGRNGVTEITTL